MDINTTISIDMADLANELEDYIRECAEEMINQNDNNFQDDDDVQGMIDGLEVLDADDVSEMITTALDDHDTELNGELIDLRNEVLKARRSIQVLLEEREARLGMRIKRATHNIKGTVGRKVRRIKDRLTRKDTNND